MVLQTLGKAWGLAALRVGSSFAAAEIIGIMNRIKPPYNINAAAQHLASEALEEVEQVNEMIRILVAERDRLAAALEQHPPVQHV